MKAYLDRDPILGRVYYFREGLHCAACHCEIDADKAAVFRTYGIDNKKAPAADVVHKSEGDFGCDQQPQRGESLWSDLDLGEGLLVRLITLHHRALSCLVLNGVMTEEERESQLSLFAELAYAYAERHGEAPEVMEGEEILEKVDQLELEAFRSVHRI
jgi:hypothetical protein